MQQTISNKHYKTQLNKKIDALKAAFKTAGLIIPEPQIYQSPIEHFRMRAEFRIWHKGERSFYAMHHPDTKEIYTLEQFPIASKTICECMPVLIEAINNNEQLSRKAFQVEFLSSTTDQLLVSLIYHRPLDDDWIEQAKQLETQLNAHLIGRSRKQKIIVSQDYVIEKMTINNKTYSYQQTENSFTQPNAAVCQHMLQWACDRVKQIDSGGDLLELYCGNGNFTLPLSTIFNDVLATEVSKTSVRSAQYNVDINNIENVRIVRLSSEETVQALNRERTFTRLKEIQLDDYQFSTVFVDPPRAGLDSTTLELVKRFENIIYISCNPETFINNVQQLNDYTIKSFAAFDQFPYTNHLEVGAILKRTS